MLTGSVPFTGTNPSVVYSDILKLNLHWPKDSKESISPEARDLLDRMLQLDPTKRLGCTLESLQYMKSHPFFDSVRFDQVSTKEYKEAFS